MSSGLAREPMEEETRVFLHLNAKHCLISWKGKITERQRSLLGLSPSFVSSAFMARSSYRPMYPLSCPCRRKEKKRKKKKKRKEKKRKEKKRKEKERKGKERKENYVGRGN
eukprot:1131408-Pelagomonas_calceolata.AAC.6